MYIDSTNVDNTDYMLGGANTILTCTTAVATANKTVTTELPFELHNDLSFKIKFTNGNSATSNVKLQINSTTNTAVTFTGNTILKANVVYDCHYNGTSYVINNSAYEFEGKTWRETALNGILITTNTEAITTSSTGYDTSSTTSHFYTFSPTTPVGDVALATGSVVRVTFQYALQTNDSSNYALNGVKLNYGGRTGFIVAQRGNESNGYANVASHVFSTTIIPTYNKRVWDKWTTLELMWTGSVWLVMGNPVLCSYFSTTQSYTVYANGLITQWGVFSPESSGWKDIPLLVYYNNTPVGIGNPFRSNNRDYNTNYRYFIAECYINHLVFYADSSSCSIRWEAMGY